jgi:hypothetical protein
MGACPVNVAARSVCQFDKSASHDQLHVTRKAQDKAGFLIITGLVYKPVNNLLF